jgi:superfamily II DNA/RNA helicase
LTTFNELGLAEQISRALIEQEYVTPTPIQAQAIPVLLTGRDLIGIAQTGTGKTAAFALPILNRLAANRVQVEPKSCRVLVLSPTRELSGQIVDSFKTYGKYLRLRVALAIGGVSIGGQARQLNGGVDVLVATPGRLLDLVQQNAVRLKNVEVLVLDEADRMLDMGFIRDIRKIVAKLPTERQTLLFSATMPQDIAELAKQILKNPASVSVTPVSSTVERIAQRVIHVDRGAKLQQLIELLRTETVNRVLVFSRTKHGADKIARGLTHAGIASEAIHGNKSQNNRTRTLAAFRSGEIKTLIATDIAARGIDVDGVTHVINYDLPNEPESYVHRIGRTARAGAEGIAISLCSSDERDFLRQIERLIRITIPSSRSEIVGQPVNARQLSGEERRHAERGNRGGPRNGNQRNGQSRSRGPGQDRGNRQGQGAGQQDRNNGAPQQARAQEGSHEAPGGRPHHRGGNRPHGGGQRDNHSQQGRREHHGRDNQPRDQRPREQHAAPQAARPIAPVAAVKFKPA